MIRIILAFYANIEDIIELKLLNEGKLYNFKDM